MNYERRARRMVELDTPGAGWPDYAAIAPVAMAR